MKNEAVPIGCDLHQLADTLQVLAGAAEDGRVKDFIDGARRVAEELEAPSGFVQECVLEKVIRDFVARSSAILGAVDADFPEDADPQEAFGRWVRSLAPERLPLATCLGRLRPEVRGVLRKMQRDYGEPLRLKDLAGAVGWSAPYLCEMFRRSVGIGVHECLTRIRIAKAVSLLRAGTNPEAVASLVGFRSRSRFYHAFRRAAGCTPGEFQRTRGRITPVRSASSRASR